MRRNLSCLLPFGAAAAAALCLGSAAMAQPANDLCTAPIPLTLSTPVAGDNATATSTNDGPAPTCQTSSNKGVWYTFTTATAGSFEVTTCGSTQDTIITVFTTDCTTFTQLGCDDDTCDGITPPGSGLASFIGSVALPAGTSHIRISSFGATPAGGAFTLTVNPSTAGACCSSTGTCTAVSMATCNATATNTFLGQGVACTPTNPCTALVGACCNTTTGACTTNTTNGCPTLTSTFSGAGTTCTPNSPCPNVGSCCSTTGVCTIRSAGGCTGTSIFTLGATSCTPNPCTALLGACCTTTGTCSNVTVNGCTGTSVFSGAGTTCLANPCPNTGACCSTTGTCTVTLSTSCTGTSLFQGVGVACAPTNPCTALLGACCSTTTGACTAVTVNGCVSPSVFSGVGTVCDPSPCPDVGSCCSATLACTIRSAAGCVAPSVFTLGGTTCTPNPCCTGPALTNDECSGATPVVVGTAAMGDTCLATNSAGVPVPSCQASTNKDIWFTFTAPATAAYTLTTCNSNFDTVLIIYTGICGGTLTEVECDDDDEVAPCNGLNSLIINRVLTAGVTYPIRVGSFSTSFGTVSLLITAQNALGACCNGAACTPTDGANCAAPGIFTSGGVCSPNPCVGSGTGACCCGSTCSATTSAACVGANTSYSGDGTVCNAFGVNNLAPCCLSDFNQSGGAASVQDIFDFLSAYFSSNACADINGASGVTVQDIFDFLSAYFTGGCV